MRRVSSIDPRKDHLDRKGRSLRIIAGCEQAIKEVSPEFSIVGIPDGDMRAIEKAILMARFSVLRPYWREHGFPGFLRQLAPKSISDLAAAVTLYRPALFRFGPWELYMARGEDPASKVPTLGLTPVPERYRSILDEVIGPTRYCPIYKEQAYDLAIRLAGFSEDEAAAWVSGLRSRERSQAEKMSALFRSRMLERGESEEVVDAICEAFEFWASLSFPRSFAFDCATIAYQLGYLKAHYPRAFAAVTGRRRTVS